eukprot:TRINITY_DN5566_c0_g1_i3.p1 TRINITY_DN5566_c0_g1~~TRINITY_DN5566_c0_g1_i3.p1  ORF type:complete len:100 (-),score=17.87 TRINITY_DN5566_c0_g1_i3:103-402(-)
MEQMILTKRFNQLGALHLERDVRVLLSHFSGISVRMVRDKFTRLNQMVIILNLEKVSAISEIWGDQSEFLTWRLTPEEVRKVLKLRVEFRQEAIAQLRL